MRCLNAKELLSLLLFLLLALVGVNQTYTTLGHVDKRAGRGPRLQTRLDAAQQVVGLQQEKHFARNSIENLADLAQVFARLRLDFH